jgi:hypothetical protein
MREIGRDVSCVGGGWIRLAKSGLLSSPASAPKSYNQAVTPPTANKPPRDRYAPGTLVLSGTLAKIGPGLQLTSPPLTSACRMSTRFVASRQRRVSRTGASLHLPWTAKKPLAACGILRCQSRPFRLRGRTRGRSVIGETPEWTLWALVGLLLFVMLLPALKR